MTGSRLSERPRASIKVRAALAGGLVFGIAAGLTVASWTDAERVGATFTASSFNLQTNVQGAGVHVDRRLDGHGRPRRPPGSIPEAPAPGTSRCKVKTAAVSVAGTVRLSAAANGGAGLTPVLRSRIVTIRGQRPARRACSRRSDLRRGHQLHVPHGQRGSAGDARRSRVAANGGGAEVHYCIELSIATATVQATYRATAATATWTVTGQS